MAGSCEISNIFSNYISAMYQPEEAQPPMELLAHLGKEDNLTLWNPAPGLEGRQSSWFGELPYFWSKAQVLEWIGYHVEKNKYDASAINFSCCNMDGYTLCHCTQEQLRLIFGPLGDELYTRLQEIVSVSDELTWIIDLLEKEDMSSQEIFQDSGKRSVLAAFCPSRPLPCACPFSPGDWGSGASVGHSCVACLGCSPQVSSHVEQHGLCCLLDHLHPRSGRWGADLFPGCRELPLLSWSSQPWAPRGTHLWEFIRDILLHPELNEGLMKWEDRREGIFKFLRSEAVAQLWGQKKKNSSMTYEKLSRAMRYYYKREILERVDGRRLVYKFGKNSSGWKEEEVLNRK
uniref:E74 like ETS transcription factor 3 n=1 Tax=Chelonoidis abingdonii TaxID=106734 RepID=A0A8C0HEK1_CHEAB